MRPIDPIDLIPIAQFDEAEIGIVVSEARRYGKDVAAHAYGGPGAQAAIAAGVRSIEHGILLDEPELQRIVERGTFWVPTLRPYSGLSSTPLHDGIRARHRAAFEIALRLGAKIAFGTDVGSFPHGEQIDEFDLMVAYGMSPLAALRAATTVAADLLRRDGRIGTLHPGASADLIAVDGDPIEDIGALRRLIFVMREGRVARDDRHTAARWVSAPADA
jgi:imidazolonepropionase-like amidohydrolase